MRDENNEPASQDDEASSTTSGAAQRAAEGYLGHVQQVLTKPDEFFEPGTRSPKLNGLISIGIFLFLILLQSLLGRVTRFSSWNVEFGYFAQAIKTTLAIGIPIAAVLFVLKWQAGRSKGPDSLDFYIEKFGAALIVPTLLLFVAIPLNVLHITIDSWFRAAALITVYIGVFMMSYWYAAPRRLHVAIIFALGFYFAYRLLLLLF